MDQYFKHSLSKLVQDVFALNAKPDKKRMNFFIVKQSIWCVAIFLQQVAEK